MYKDCKSLYSSERQKEFEKVLFNMMEKQHFKEITITALCKEMDAPRKAFYRYFDTMEDVLNAQIDDALLTSFLHMEGRAELTKFFEYWKKNKQLLEVLEKNAMDQKLMDRAFVLMISRETPEGLSGKDMMFAGYISALITILILWNRYGMRQSIEEMAQLTEEIFGKH